jgi:hypothetical protein
MTYVQDKYGIMVPHSALTTGFSPIFNEREDNTTKIYTTKDGKPMLKQEVDFCVKEYQKTMGAAAKTILIPTSLAEHKASLEVDFKLSVQVVATMRHNGIHLSMI